MADLIKWNSDPFSEFDRMFEDFFPMIRANRSQFSQANTSDGFMGFDMAVDVYEQDDKVIAEMNLPGIDPEQVDVEVENGVLRISGQRSADVTNEDKEGNYFRREIRRGSFSRVVSLPETANTEKSSAHYKDGVLKITMDKKEEKDSQSKKLQIKQG